MALTALAKGVKPLTNQIVQRLLKNSMVIQPQPLLDIAVERLAFVGLDGTVESTLVVAVHNGGPQATPFATYLNCFYEDSDTSFMACQARQGADKWEPCYEELLPEEGRLSIRLDRMLEASQHLLIAAKVKRHNLVRVIGGDLHFDDPMYKMSFDNLNPRTVEYRAAVVFPPSAEARTIRADGAVRCTSRTASWEWGAAPGVLRFLHMRADRTLAMPPLAPHALDDAIAEAFRLRDAVAMGENDIVLFRLQTLLDELASQSRVRPVLFQSPAFAGLSCEGQMGSLQQLILQLHEVRADLLSTALSSTFISYGGPDSAFAETLRDRLRQNGVQTFLFSRDAEVGQKLHRVMSNGVNEHDRIVLICSKNSLGRPGVLNEIEQTLARESREGGSALLLPITLDDFVFSDWTPSRPDLSRAIRDRVVGDFRGADKDPAKLALAFDRLLKALIKPPGTSTAHALAMAFRQEVARQPRADDKSDDTESSEFVPPDERRNAEAERATACPKAQWQEDTQTFLSAIKDCIPRVRENAYKALMSHIECRHRDELISLLDDVWNGGHGEILDLDRAQIVKLWGRARAWQFRAMLVRYWLDECGAKDVSSEIHNYFYDSSWGEPGPTFDVALDALKELTQRGGSATPTSSLLELFKYAIDSPKFTTPDWKKVNAAYELYKSESGRFPVVDDLRRALRL